MQVKRHCNNAGTHENHHPLSGPLEQALRRGLVFYFKPRFRNDDRGTTG